jgi:TolB-like protein/Flp pilus assembly protein TadD
MVTLGVGWFALSPADSGHEATDRSIAVLPFETLGPSDNTSFADGVHGDLLTRLSHILDLDVISRTSVLRYRNSEASVPSIAADLGVAWILHGEVQESGGEVQVNARLVDARADRQVWANGYRRTLTAENLFDIQEDITRHIASALQTQLSPGEEAQVARIPTENIEAYRRYALGREQLDRRDEEGFRRALDYFRQAVATDSSYAMAWVGMADALTLLYSYRYAEAEEVIPDAERAVQRALELNPRSAEAHASLGLLQGVRMEGEGSLRELRRAVELRPGYAEAHNWLSYVSLLQGDSQEALKRATRAVELNPLSPEAVSNLSLSLLAVGEMERALVEARRVIELQEAWTTGYFYEALALYHLGRFQNARAVLQGLEVPWAGEGPVATLALAHLALGDSAAARGVLGSLNPEEAPFATGLIRLALGEKDAAFSDFQRMERWGDWPMLAVHHLYGEIWNPVLGDPRYDALLRRAWENWHSGPASGDAS